MKLNIAFKKEYAVSEVVGGLILIIVAVVTFSAIYSYITLPGPDYNPSVEIIGSVTEEGNVMLQHCGGNTIEQCKIIVCEPNGNLLGEKTEENWNFGEYRYPLLDITDKKLVNDSVMLDISVWSIGDDGSEEMIFTWEACGIVNRSSTEELENPMLISSLRYDTTDEDLICYNYTINPEIDALTYIYQWIVNGNSLTNVLLSFDNNTLDYAKDYSGENNDGTLFGPSWVSNGIVGGAYQFDGVDNYISLPYCFDISYIDEFTVETWIRTTSENTVIASYDADNYWELGIRSGLIYWSTTANGDTIDAYGTTTINDDVWHHIACTYDSLTGDCTIFLDGNNEKDINCHSPGEMLGSGSSPNGYIGTGNIGVFPGTWYTITYDDFESGFGSYTDGGRDCLFYTDGTYAHQGSNAANIQDNSGIESSFYHTNTIDVDTPGYTSIKVDFWFIARDMEWGEDFWVRFFDGSNWITVADYHRGNDFNNEEFYHEIVWINESEYTFPTDMKIRFQCDASYDWDDIFIDEVYVNASTGNTIVSNFSGRIDEFTIYKRVLSGEQIFQNYLCTKDGASDKRVIVSDETVLGETWRCIVTPNDSNQDDESVESNYLLIKGYGG